MPPSSAEASRLRGKKSFPKKLAAEELFTAFRRYNDGMDGDVSSRTPEGIPSRCAVCGAETNIEFSSPTGDAPCPQCGHLLWRSATTLNRVLDQLGVSPENVTAKTTFQDLGTDSLDMVELVMELEEEFDVNIPDDVAEKLQTVGDAIRYIESHRTMTQLPPLRFTPLLKRYLWGGRRLGTLLGKPIMEGDDYAESWEVA